ncbi:rod shape-determining protein [Candidatus Dojkabacteria bacterium]|uniref:Cell shape-determining protein MreB n=1 Tax=Candidatus Dojkabacteria bacterium TaxID=2099670 RepID=A0A955RI94_9BACT|nr:rod shape-determining protein [Candidatus Dojkabacteria bacterium]
MLFSKKSLGIDLGTSYTRIYLPKEGLVVNEPTVVAVSIEDRKVVAVGNDAKDMIGKVPDNIVAKRPLKSGVIASYKMTQSLLEHFIKKSLGRSRFVRPDVMISVPAGITTVEERAVIEAAVSAGAGKVHLIPEPLAAAIGAGLPINTSSGNMIVNLGGGTTEVAVISMNGIVTFNSARVGGDDINTSIANWLRRNHNLLIGEQMAEQAKITIGTAMETEQFTEMEISGRDISEGMPRSLTINSNELVGAIRPVVDQMISAIKKVLEKTPPELSSDVIDRGMVLTGGTANLRLIDDLLTKATGVAAVTVDDPMFCVAKGTSEAIKHIDLIKRSLR